MMIKNLFRHNEKKKKISYNSFYKHTLHLVGTHTWYNNKYTLKISIQKLKLNDKINDDYDK